MKNLPLLLLAAILLEVFVASAQTTEPTVQFTLRLEDALGNVDSIQMGYDSLGGFQINPEFGEADLTEVPFDSQLEVRGGSAYYENLTNPSVVTWFSAMCSWNDFIKYQVLYFNAKNLPVLISWDSTYFATQDCYDWSHFTRNWGYVLHPGGNSGPIVRFSEQSSFLITQSYLSATETFNTSFFKPLSDGSTGYVYALFVGLGAEEPNGSINTSEPGEAQALVASPNPVTSVLNVKWLPAYGQAAFAQWVGMDGRAYPLALASLSQGSVDVSGLRPGCYVLQVRNEQGRLFLSKIIKE